MSEAQDSAKKQIQRALIQLLLTESDLAFTLLRTAAIESDIDPRQSQIALERARVALDSIRRFLMQVEDAAVRAEILASADELEAMHRSRTMAAGSANDRQG
jgi:hypothetical protein